MAAQNTANILKPIATLDPDTAHEIKLQYGYFKAEPVLQKGEEIKAIIIERQNENYRKMQESKRLSNQNLDKTAAQEEEERSEACGYAEIGPRLLTVFQQQCPFHEPRDLCDNNIPKASQLLANAANTVTKIDSSVFSQLDQTRKTLAQILKQVESLNNSCLRQYESIVQSETCLSSFQTVFNNQMNTYLKHNCTVETVDKGISEFISIMRDQDRGIGDTIYRIQNAYSKTRHTEAGVAKILINIDDSIKQHLASNPRTPTSTSSINNGKTDQPQ